MKHRKINIRNNLPFSAKIGQIITDRNGKQFQIEKCYSGNLDLVEVENREKCLICADKEAVIRFIKVREFFYKGKKI